MSVNVSRLTFLIVVHALIFSPFAHAEPILTLAVSCPSASQIEPFIMMCGHNKFVALQAKFCADDLARAWTSAAQVLIPKLQARGSESNQNSSEEDTRKNYRDTVQSLHEQIVQMQTYTAVIAEYPHAMIDLPASHGDETSLSCFNEAFHQVQEIVTYLDGEIVRAKKIKGAATALMISSDSRHQALADTLTNGPAGGVGYAPIPAGENPRSASSITGEINEVMLSSRTAAAELQRNVQISGARPFVSRGGPNREKEGILAVFSDDNRDLFKSISESAKTAPAASSVSSSVGSTIWNEVQGSMAMNVPTATQARGSVASLRNIRAFLAGVFVPTGRKAPPEEALEEQLAAGAKVRRAPAESLHRQGSLALASVESNLFQVVSQRYRATELFRRARVSKAPLGAVEPSPKY